jgi:hypothetical protein
MAWIRTRLLWSGCGVLFVVTPLLLLGSAQAQGTAAGSTGRAISPARAQATLSSPAGLWRASSGRLYQWVAISGGYEARFVHAYTLKNSCPVRSGDAASRFYNLRDDLYRALNQVWRGVCVRYRCGRCTTHWEAAGRVKIIVSGERMTVSCANRPEQACSAYTRVGD